jgi:hypothetical protein
MGDWGAGLRFGWGQNTIRERGFPMNFGSGFAASERQVWRLGCGLALAGLALALWYLNGRSAPDSGRLYWEYAGRMLHAPVTNGYIEWVQHRVGVVPKLASAARAARRLAPYSGFPSEYPPGSLLYFAVLRYFSDDIFGFSRLTHLVAAAMFFAVMAISLHYLRKIYDIIGGKDLFLLYLVLPLVAISPILIGPFAISRFDMLPTVFAVIGLALFLERLPLPAAVMLGLGAASKLWPGIFIPLLAANYWRFGEKNLKPLAMVVVGGMGFLIPHVIMLAMGTSPAHLFDYLKYLGARPPQIESSVANVVVILSHLTGMPVRGGFDFGSQNVYSVYSKYVITIFSVINAAVLLFSGITVLYRSRNFRNSATSDVVTIFACGLCVCTTMACSRVFSSEYMMWPLPLVLFLFLDRRGMIGVVAFIVSVILLKAIFWDYDNLIDVETDATLICLAKNVIFLITAAVFGWRMVKFDGRAVDAEGFPVAATASCA